MRVDTGVAEGDVIPAEFDSMIAKLIAWGRDRDEALARLRRALADTMVVVDGGTTNQGFLLELLDRPEVRAGDVDTDVARPARQSAARSCPSATPTSRCSQAAIELAEAETAPTARASTPSPAAGARRRRRGLERASTCATAASAYRFARRADRARAATA